MHAGPSRTRPGDGMLTAEAPDDGDIVVRAERRGEKRVYLLRTALAADHVVHLSHVREEAIAQALMWAEQGHVRAWLTDAGHDLALLEDFRVAKSA